MGGCQSRSKTDKAIVKNEQAISNSKEEHKEVKQVLKRQEEAKPVRLQAPKKSESKPHHVTSKGQQQIVIKNEGIPGAIPP